MALNWDVGDIENYKEMCFETRTDDNGSTLKDEDGETILYLKSVTDRLIWGTMGVKMGSITEKNHKEFFARLRIMEKLDGYPPDNRVTYEEVRAHIGLRTNVCTDTWAKFLKGFRTQYEGIAESAARKFEKIAAEGIAIEV